MTESLSPLTVGLTVAGLITVIVVITVVLIRAFREVEPKTGVTLPQGADAALWSIVEAMPDPRNHLALTRDLSGEVRITDDDRALAAALFADIEPVSERLVNLRDDEPGVDLTEYVFLDDESRLTRS